MDFNPILTEIQSHYQAMSPEAQGAVHMAGMVPPPPGPATQNAPGTLAPHQQTEQPPTSLSLPQSTPTLPSFSSEQPHVNAPRGTIHGDAQERSRLLSDGPPVDSIYHNITNSGFGQDHPVLGKILGGVGEVAGKIGDTLANGAPGIAREIPGTTIRHNMLLGQANTALGQDETNAQKEAQTAAQQAEIPLRAAQADKAQAQASGAEPVEITPEQAQSLGMPELAGEKVSPAILARLSGQHQGNTTKEDTTNATVAGRKDVAGINANSREKIAGENNQTKENIAAKSDAVKKTLESMRVASGIGKGANGSTMTTRAMAEMATTVLPRMTAISAEVDKMANDLGPAVGRWNDLMVNKGGADHPEFAHLDANLDLLASAIVRTHFGAHGGQQYRQELRKQFGEAQSPEDLKARIAAAQDWIQGYADMDKGAPQGTPGQGAAPQEGTTKINGDGDKVIYKGGKWQPAP
jgi:hypothetical protein